MNCCLFKKCSPKKENVRPVRFPGTEPVDQEVVKCGRCQTEHAIPQKALVMVCSNCRCVNRIQSDGLQRRVSFIDCDVGDSEIIQNTATVFQLGESSDGRSIPICSVCLDGVGDIVLEHCGHGGICEACARHIALNRAVGGAHCPLDKRDISHISRIGELHAEFVKVRAIDLPEPVTSEPPRVPPPVGLRKSKDAEPKTM